MSEDDCPLVDGRVRNKARELLGRTYRAKTNPPNMFPEIGAVEVQNAIGVVESLLAEKNLLTAKVAELEKKLEASLILATELVLELKHYCKEPVHDSQLKELSRQRLALT